MREMLYYVIRLPLKFYIASLVFFLIWRKRRIPKWLQSKIDDELETPVFLQRPEKYRK